MKTTTKTTTKTTVTRPDGRCPCGHILDRSTDEWCRHCVRSPEARAARLAAKAAK